MKSSKTTQVEHPNRLARISSSQYAVCTHNFYVFSVTNKMLSCKAALVTVIVRTVLCCFVLSFWAALLKMPGHCLATETSIRLFLQAWHFFHSGDLCPHSKSLLQSTCSLDLDEWRTPECLYTRKLLSRVSSTGVEEGFRIPGLESQCFQEQCIWCSHTKKLKGALCDACVTPRWCYVAQFMHAVTLWPVRTLFITLVYLCVHVCVAPRAYIPQYSVTVFAKLKYTQPHHPVLNRAYHTSFQRWTCLPQSSLLPQQEEELGAV